MTKDPFLEEEESGGINIQELMFKLLAQWKWIAASVVVCMVGAYVYLKFQLPVYRISSTVLLKDDKRGTPFDQMSTLQDWGLVSGSANVENEMVVIRSRNLLKKVVTELKLYASYSLDDRLPKQPLYKNSPVTVDMDSIATLNAYIGMKVKMLKDGKLQVKGNVGKETFEGTLDALPAVMSTPVGVVNFYRNEAVEPIYDEEITIGLVNPLIVASGYAGGMEVVQGSKNTSVINLALSETNVARGKDFLNKVVDVYNRDAIDDKNRVALNTEAFIEERLAKLDVELGSAERDLESYKKRERLTDIQSEAQLAVQGNTEYRRMQVELETQLNLLKYLQDYMKNDKKMEKLVPANVGIQDATLQQLVQQYNLYQLERERLLRTSSEQNPAVQNLNSSIRAMYESILASLHSVEQTLLISKKNLERQTQIYDNRISNVPTIEREYTEKARQQQIKQQLFLILLQKREENSLALAVTVTSAKVIDDASASGPVSPRRSMIYMIALVIGFAFPIGMIYLLELLNFKIRTRSDLERLTKASVLGEVPLSKSDERVVVKENVNNSMAESFRAIRTNLQFTLANTDHRVIMVTSSVPGEGKSYVSINLAMSMALVNKKILLVGLDVRKPTLAAYMKLSRKAGATSYLANLETDLDRLIVPSGISENLDVLPAGPVPPNPAELLLSERLDSLFAELRRRYDFILVDTAPIGVVSDSLIVGRVADATVYVARSEVTYKKYLSWVDDLQSSKKLPTISMVLNGVEVNKKSYGYGYGYGYGRGYGYGYGYGRGYGQGYYEEEGEDGKKGRRHRHEKQS